jgi:hypothetical protein
LDGEAVRQYSLFHITDGHREVAVLASLLPLVRAAMNMAAEAHPTLSRDLIADRMSELARQAGVKLTSGNAKAVKTATLDKWVSRSDREHPPSITALVAFCLATGSSAPLEPLLAALGCEVMTPEDRRLRDYGKAVLAEREAKKTKRKLEADF